MPVSPAEPAVVSATPVEPPRYVPPRPLPLSPIAALIRTAAQREGNLLSLLPAAAYRLPVTHLGYSRRSILLVNEPQLVHEVMQDSTGIYPKNDLMVGALEPLVGDSIFVSSGQRWRRQRDMIDPAFSHIRLTRAFASMRAAVDDYEQRLDRLAVSGESFSLDLAMSHLTADIICRTVFSTSLESQIAREVFDAFEVFERSAAQVELKALIFDPPFKKIRQHRPVLDACARIRAHLGELVDSHVSAADGTFNDIASACIAARDSASGCPFSRKELVDQLGVLFLAGHETTASVLTWLFYILSVRPEVVARIRAEVDAVVGDGPVEFEHIKKLRYVRNVFRETLRLYPPITFIPRVAMAPTRIGRYRVKRGAMVMISPWTTHRHRRLWSDPDVFDPDRFLPEREHELTPGAYLPFGMGPRTCVGAGFAQHEASLIIARLTRRFDLSTLAPDKVRPVARLTTRPVQQIHCRVTPRADR
ncbi:MAG: cytochrome P450 [Gammaproteobacteria bacterium]|nr:cytochrome P450 [Gammaproteobacteria bacterium]